MSRFTKKSLSNQLLVSILGIYIFITFVVTIAHIVVDYSYTKHKIQSELEQIAHIFEPALQTAIWNLNEEQLQSIARGIQEMPLVYGVLIQDQNNKTLFISHKNGSTTIGQEELLYSFPIFQPLNGNKIFLAKVTINSDEQAIFDRLKAGLVMLFLNALIKTVALIILFYLAFRRHLERPLQQLMSQISNIKEKEHNAQLIYAKLKNPNELSRLQSKFNELLRHIYIQEELRIESMQSQNRQLEELVRDRTKELEIANQKLLELSTIDELTSVANRRHFNEVLTREWAHATRTKKPLTLLMIDVDYFKKYNDTYGHIAGDDCLRLVASTLKINTKRTNDLTARYGGEEFAIVMPDTDETSAMLIAEKIRQSIEALNIPHEFTNSKKVTISIGVCTKIPNNTATDSNIIIALADEALYEAKESGRNKVVQKK